MTSPFHGLGIALVTPFDAYENVDFQALERLLDYTLPVDYYVVLGTTGESPTVTAEEKKAILQTVIRKNNGRKPIVLGLGGNNTQALVDQLKDGNFQGVDAFLSITPYYNKPTQAGMIAHFSKLADFTPRPIILYNAPGRTGVDMKAETVATLAKHPNIIGIKEAGGSLARVDELLDRCPEDFLLLSGDDDLAAETIRRGGHGVISVMGNAYPDAFGQWIREAKNHSAEALARVWDLRWAPLNSLLYQEGNPVGIKTLLSELDICRPDVRLPLVKGSESLRQAIAAAKL